MGHPQTWGRGHDAEEPTAVFAGVPAADGRPVWNRIPERIRAQGIETALVHNELSPRELACRITDREGEFLSESSVYRILKAEPSLRKPAQRSQKI